MRSETCGADFAKTDFHDVMTFKIWCYDKHILNKFVVPTLSAVKKEPKNPSETWVRIYKTIPEKAVIFKNKSVYARINNVRPMRNIKSR